MRKPLLSLRMDEVGSGATGGVSDAAEAAVSPGGSIDVGTARVVEAVDVAGAASVAVDAKGT